jgi:hypothetical protein
MADPFTESHRAKEKADNREAARQELARIKQEAAKRMLDRMKPVFNDLPTYKIRHSFKFGPQ